MSAASPTAPKAKSKSTRNATRESKDQEKDKERDTSKEEKLDRLKTVVRRLPPNLPEDVFWQSVQTWVTDENVNWKVFYSGKVRTRFNKENIPSRAYIAFKSEEQLALFSQGYDGHLFRDKAGNESIAVVEFAPYQKIPTEKKKTDARGGTIEKDEDYLSFLESLRNKNKATGENGEPPSLESLIAATQPAPQPKTTPLLEALKAQKEKDKEAAAARTIARKEIQVAAAAASHSKDVSTSGNKKEVEKKGAKGGKAQGAEVGTLGKKAGKKGKAAHQASASQAKPGPSVSTSTSTPTAVPAQKSAQKPPRQPRPAQTQIQPVQTPSPAIAPNKASSASGAGGEGSQPQQAQRRSRPVIASRGFEAALSGAGVGVNVAQGRTQGQRERKERDGAAGGVAGAEVGVEAGKEGGKEHHLTRKERERERERKRKEKDESISKGEPSSGAGTGNAGTSGSDVLPAPTILTREAPTKILARPAAADGTSATVGIGGGPGVLNVNMGDGGVETRGGTRGGRRGRVGRGRGRGGG